jgi:Tol biopolymer transport system component
MSDLMRDEVNRVARQIGGSIEPDFDKIIRRGKRHKLVRALWVTFTTSTIAVLGWMMGLGFSDDRAPITAQAPSNSEYRLVFSAYGNSGEPDIFVARADGSDSFNLTDDPIGNAQPVWSPDGSKIAFIEEENKAENATVSVMNADGSNRRILIDGAGSETQPTWAPDGKAIAYVKNVDGTPEIRVVDLDGSRDRVLVDRDAVAEHPAWSNDGTRIAFASDVGTNREIFVVNADGSGLTQLTNDAAGDTHPQWSPDDSKIAFIRDTNTSLGEVFVMNSDGTSLARIGPPAESDQAFASEPTWTPSGKILFTYYDGVDWDVQRIQSDGQGRENVSITRTDPRGADLRP